MSIKIKLLISFFSMALLTYVVSMIFYTQLKNLIRPLAPQSIPINVEELSREIVKSDLVFRILYQQLLVDYSLENYAFTKRSNILPEYYLNNALLFQLVNEAKKLDPNFPRQLENDIKTGEVERNIILKLIQTNQLLAEKEFQTNSYYAIITQNIRANLNRYYQQTYGISTETAVLSVKMAVKNANSILQHSLNTTLIIVIDAIIISFVLALISARAISQPINLLKNNIDHMSTESLSVSIDPSLLKLKGEIGDLSRSFENLIERLRSTTVLRDELMLEVKHRKKIENELRQTALNLQESNQALDQFASIASHDLRAPLRAIKNLSEWILEDSYGNLSEKSRTHFDLLRKRVQRLDTLVTGILEYSRAGIISKEVEFIDINQLLREIIENFLPIRNIAIHVDNNMPTIICNRAAITQVFQNLLNNAIKYLDKPQGIINIGFKSTTKFYQFYVVDNGPGIDKKFQKKVFDIFQTVQPRDTTESTGIGLAIVKRIVEKSSGKIWLTSEVGQGTTFYFTWPRS